MDKFIFVTIPRSGHHLIERLAITGAGFGKRYCEHYTVADCCRAIPCTRPEISFQKTHDFKLDVPEHTSAKYIVQYRGFLHSSVSDFEFAVTSTNYRDTYEDWLTFSQYRKSYWARFMQKWVVPFRQNERYLLINYDELVADLPAWAVRIANFLGVEAEQAMVRSLAAAEPVIQRDLSTFEYFDHEYFYEVERSLDMIYELAKIIPVMSTPTYNHRNYHSYWLRIPPVEKPRLPGKRRTPRGDATVIAPTDGSVRVESTAAAAPSATEQQGNTAVQFWRSYSREHGSGWKEAEMRSRVAFFSHLLGTALADLTSLRILIVNDGPVQTLSQVKAMMSVAVDPNTNALIQAGLLEPNLGCGETLYLSASITDDLLPQRYFDMVLVGCPVPTAAAAGTLLSSIFRVAAPGARVALNIRGQNTAGKLSLDILKASLLHITHVHNVTVLGEANTLRGRVELEE